MILRISLSFSTITIDTKQLYLHVFVRIATAVLSVLMKVH